MRQGVTRKLQNGALAGRGRKDRLGWRRGRKLQKSTERANLIRP